MVKAANPPLVFDPILERVAPQAETSSERLRRKFTKHYEWCFCELCWRSTEYSVTLDAPRVIKRLLRGNAKLVSITPSMERAAQERTDRIVTRYREACDGQHGRYEAARLWACYCDPIEMRGDRSVFGFEDHVKRRMLITEWARHGQVARPSRLAGQSEHSAKPSRLYCEFHNPRRSENARRAYQRDRRFRAEYEEFILLTRSEVINRGQFRSWDIEAHVEIRRTAYQLLQGMKSPTRLIDDLIEQEGAMTQAEIGRRLGISRQAVSAALRRRPRKVKSAAK